MAQLKNKTSLKESWANLPFHPGSCLRRMTYDKVNQMSIYIYIQGDLNVVFLARGNFTLLMLQLEILYCN